MNNSTRPPFFIFYGRGAAIRMHQPTLPNIDDKPRGQIGGKRGQVAGYSAASRARLRRTLWAVEPALMPRRTGPGSKTFIKPGSFVTLTYPGTVGWREEYADARRCKQHLRAWWKRVQWRWPDAWAVWCVEVQQRGAWHFHLVVRWTPPKRGEVQDRQAWVSQTWAEVVAEGRDPDPDHLKASTRVDALISPKVLAAYVDKPGTKGRAVPHVGVHAAGELAKRAQKNTAFQGRWWGVQNKPAYRHCTEVLAAHLPAALAVRVAMAMENHWREYARGRGFEWEWQPPAWLAGRELDQALHKAHLPSAQDLFANATGPAWDPATGELLDLTQREFGQAGAA